MKLKRIEIMHYRSIANIQIGTVPSCQGFVGINESGKTNILKAISLLSSDTEITRDDARIEGIHEKRNQDSEVRYIFELSKAEIKMMINEFIETIYFEASLPQIVIGGKNISISEFLYAQNKGLYCCDINDESRYPSYYALKASEIVPIPGLKKKKDEELLDSITSKTNEAIELSHFDFFESTCIDDNNALFDSCTTEDLNDAWGSLISRHVEKNLPNVIYWKYDEKFLLPSSVSLTNFKDNPNSCLPLKSMFNLAGYNNISDLISDAQTKRVNVLTSILNTVSRKSSQYLQSVWSNYKNVSFELRLNGDAIDIHIKDSENFFDCGQRSDGFKRFVTFLLALSARVNNGEIKDTIIVVDEPDMGIHILGQKNLLQELIKISKNNLVFYSTHSIFMIDKTNTSRHFIVSKKNEITTITQATESNYTDDEVLFNALGYSIFEALMSCNIVFEGWSDKRVFELSIANYKARQIGNFKNIGKVHATGVKTIISIAKNLELANREYFVISDSDKPAKEKRSDYKEKEQCVGEWYLYEDFVPGIVTLEDFIRHASFKASIEAARGKYNELNVFDYEAFKNQKHQRENFIRFWIKSTIKDNEVVNSILKEIKNHLYSILNSASIEDEYFTFLSLLKNQINA